MKTITYIIIQICICTAALAQFQLHWQNPYPQGQSLGGIDALPDGTIIAVGGGGTVMRRFPGQTEWEVRHHIISDRGGFGDLHFVDSQNGWAYNSGLSAQIYTTSDGGDTWTPRPVGSGAPRDLYAIDPMHAWIVGDTRYVERTTDGGQTWTLTDAQLPDYPLAVFFLDENIGWTAGVKNQFNVEAVVYKTVDGGETWNKLPDSGMPKFLNTIFFLDEQTGWIGGEDGLILHTNDGGQTWTTQVVFDVSTFYVLQDIYFWDENDGVAAGADGQILYTSNGGAHWMEAETDLTGSDFIDDLAFEGDSIVWACGNVGLLYKSLDRGATWTSEADGFRVHWLTEVAFTDENNGWAGGHDGALARTTNGGGSWTLVDSARSFQHYISVLEFPDPDHGFRIEYEGEVWRTINGGDTWEQMLPGLVDPQQHLYTDGFFINSTTGWVVRAGDILKTTDSGANWITQLDTVGGFNDIFFTDANYGWAVGWNNFRKTTNGGDFWQQITVPHPDETFFDVYFINQNIGWAAGAKGLMYKTEDGGDSWAKINTPTSLTLNDVYFLDQMTGFILGNRGVLARTTDGGDNWEVMSSPTTASFSEGYFIDADHGWIVASGGIILKYDYTMTSLDETEPLTAIPTSIQLDQNYPNPFNPTTTIRYSLSKSDYVTLAIYDVLGRRVRSAVSGWQLAGSNHSFTWDGKDDNGQQVSSGSYFYQLTAGEQTDVRRMILMK